jgi:hypothetical protein
LISSERNYFLTPPDDEEDRSLDLPPSYQSLDANRGTLEEREIKNIKRWLKHYDERIRTTDDLTFKNSYIREKAKMEKRLEKALSDNFDSDNSKTFHGSGQAMSAMPDLPVDLMTNVIWGGLSGIALAILTYYKNISGNTIGENLWKVVAPAVEQYSKNMPNNISADENPIREILDEFSEKYNKILQDFPTLPTVEILGSDNNISKLYPKIFELKIIMDSLDDIYNDDKYKEAQEPAKEFIENIKLSKKAIDDWLKEFKHSKKPNWKPDKTKSYELMTNYIKIKKNNVNKIYNLTNRTLYLTPDFKEVYQSTRDALNFQTNKSKQKPRILGTPFDVRQIAQI